MHNGSLHLLQQMLNSAGHCIPSHVNLLKLAIDVTGSLDGTQTSEALNSHPFPLQERLVCSHNLEEKLLIDPNSRLEEVVILGKRFCSNIFRTKQLFVTRVIQALVAGLVLKLKVIVANEAVMFSDEDDVLMNLPEADTV
ncbi:unnamed protein product [Prunus brigantina]